MVSSKPLPTIVSWPLPVVMTRLSGSLEKDGNVSSLTLERLIASSPPPVVIDMVFTSSAETTSPVSVTNVPQPTTPTTPLEPT